MRAPTLPAEVVLRALHVVYGREGGPAPLDTIVEHAAMPSGTVLAELLELKNERLACQVKKKPKCWLPWDGAAVSLETALDALRAAKASQPEDRLAEPETAGADS